MPVVPDLEHWGLSYIEVSTVLPYDNNPEPVYETVSWLTRSLGEEPKTFNAMPILLGEPGTLHTDPIPRGLSFVAIDDDDIHTLNTQTDYQPDVLRETDERETDIRRLGYTVMLGGMYFEVRFLSGRTRRLTTPPGIWIAHRMQTLDNNNYFSLN